MGDRANIIIKDGDHPEIYLYTHWDGYNLPKILQDGLIRGKTRWEDVPYLARILFCEMTKDSTLETTGYGISTVLTDNEHDFLVVNIKDRVVSVAPYDWRNRGKEDPLKLKPLASYSFQEYCEIDFEDDENKDQWSILKG